MWGRNPASPSFPLSPRGRGQGEGAFFVGTSLRACPRGFLRWLFLGRLSERLLRKRRGCRNKNLLLLFNPHFTTITGDKL